MNYLTNMLTGYGCVLVPLKTPAWEARVGWEKSPFFFFKQKTAYEIMPSLVGSEMCIRDRTYIGQARALCYKIVLRSLLLVLDSH